MIVHTDKDWRLLEYMDNKYWIEHCCKHLQLTSAKTYPAPVWWPWRHRWCQLGRPCDFCQTSPSEGLQALFVFLTGDMNE